MANKEAQKPLAMTERTPPRSRRQSIESASNMKTNRVKNYGDKKAIKTPSVPAHGRRSSLEGPRFGMKENTQIQVSEDVVMDPSTPVFTPVQKSVQFQDSNAISKIYDDNRPKAPRSPSSGVLYQKRAIKMDSRTSVSALQLPVTPEPQMFGRNEVQIMMQNEVTVSSSSSSRNGKGSSIRKSLRTIGRLINGSDKR